MTPQERKLIDELFDRLASLEDGPRDDDAVQAINEGLERAPNAMYPLVQTALVQDEALKRADARIRELEAELGVEPGQPARQPGFLDNMRDALLGKGASHGSVPTVRPGLASSAWGNAGQQAQGYAVPSQQEPPSGGSFLGTAAASAAGVIGGALLMNSIRGLFGGQHQSFGGFEPGASGAPWGGSASGSDLARDAGLNDIGSGSGGYDDRSQQAGLFDAPAGDDNDFDDAGGDFDGDDGGSDTT
jgi:hypothetical protein